MLDYVFVRNDKQELNIYLSNKQTRLNIDQTLSSLVILGLKNLIFRIQFQFIKNEYNKKKIFKLFNIRLLVFIKLLLAAYIMFVYALKPSTPDLDIKEIKEGQRGYSVNVPQPKSNNGIQRISDDKSNKSGFFFKRN